MIGHGTHDVKRDDTCPIAQSVHAVDPLLLAKVFDGQIRHPPLAAEKYVPGAHGVQVPIAETKWPGRAHVTQLDIPAGTYFPLGHFSHVPAVAYANVPHAKHPPPAEKTLFGSPSIAAQDKHGESPPLLVWPNGHCEHLVAPGVARE